MTPSPGIEPGPHWWKASDLSLRQPCSPYVHIHLAKIPADSLGIKIITKKNCEEPTTPDGGDGRTESPSGMYGAFSMGVSLLPDGGRDDSPSDW